MRFDFTVHADTQTELHDAIHAMLNALPQNFFDGPARAFSIQVSPEYPTSNPALTAPIHTPAVAVTETIDTPAPAADSKPKRGRPPGTKNTANAGDVPDAEPEAVPQAAPEAAPVISPTQAKLKAMDILRDCFAQPQGPAALADVSGKLGVKKFSEVPDDRGHEMLALALKAQAGLAAGGPSPEAFA